MSNQDLIRRGDVLDACQIEPYCYDSDCDSGSKLRARVSALPTATPTLADALALPEVRALWDAAKSVNHDSTHGNGLEGFRKNRDRLRIVIDQIDTALAALAAFEVKP